MKRDLHAFQSTYLNFWIKVGVPWLHGKQCRSGDLRISYMEPHILQDVFAQLDTRAIFRLESVREIVPVQVWAGLVSGVHRGLSDDQLVLAHPAS